MLLCALVAGAVAVVWLWWRGTPARTLNGPGEALTTAGRVSGLLGGYLLLVEVMLMSRIPWLERRIGSDWVAAAHRALGGYLVSVLVAHTVLIVAGYAVTAHVGMASETARVVLDEPDVLMATVALALLVGVGWLSARAVRRRLAYETWYYLHLYAYLAVLLAFAHQLAEAGQFFRWRFLTAGRWWQTHPFSLSAAPNGRFLRLTVKASGDHSGGLERRPAAFASPPAGPTVTAVRHSTAARRTTTTRHTTTARATPASGRTTTTRRATTTTTRAPASKQRLTGPAVDTQYGPVQVRVTLQGGRIVDVAALQLPNDRSRSVEISNYAAPQLRDEVLRAQSAKIDVVSGATYTSQGYIQSLQAALDSANAG